MKYRNKSIHFVMKRIKILNKELVNLIAAGEVVERPSSVIKELMENSIDAGSTLIEVRLEESGKKSIIIKDNGSGIHPEDIPLAFTQHATSKIKTQQDLNKIFSFGFRGEALASINAVSDQVVVESKVDSVSAEKMTLQGESMEQTTAVRTDSGTEISIYGLFKRTPARLKFLKSDSTELKHCIDTFLQVAIPHLHVHFELYHNGQLIHRLSKTDSLEKRVFEIWGKQVVEQSYKVDTLKDEAQHVEGMIGNTYSGKKKNPIQYIYLNNRYIQSKIISAAIKQAYTGFLHRDLQPAYVLMIMINPEKVDVNVHPRKLEVKFDDEQAMFRYIYKVVRSTLEKESKIVAQDINIMVGGSESKDIFEDFLSQKTDNRQQRIDDIPPLREEFYEAKRSRTEGGSKKMNSVSSALDFTKEFLQNRTDDEVRDEPRHEPIRVEPFQVFNTYILYEKDNELIMVDQHAAAEKILFEKLLETYGNVQTKPLLVPQIISLSNTSEKDMVLEKSIEFQNLGVHITDFGSKDIQVDEIPELVVEHRIHEFITSLLQPEENSDIRIQKNEIEFYNVTEEVYLRIATAACHGSIRAGQKLNREEMLHIISQLPLIQYPFNCPHGRPTYWKVTKYEFAKVFNRNI